MTTLQLTIVGDIILNNSLGLRVSPEFKGLCRPDGQVRVFYRCVGTCKSAIDVVHAVL